jgi:hypothetical protein
MKFYLKLIWPKEELRKIDHWLLKNCLLLILPSERQVINENSGHGRPDEGAEGERRRPEGRDERVRVQVVGLESDYRHQFSAVASGQS